jgi:hypothetical protein
MLAVARAVLTFVSAISAYVFTFWMSGALLFSINGTSEALPFLLACVAGIAAGRYVWQHTASFKAGAASSVLYGAVATGGVAFAAGFFGPIIFTPDANQGPLLGLFITGPLGFLLGAIGGWIHWLVRGRRGGDARGIHPAR